MLDGRRNRNGQNIRIPFVLKVFDEVNAIKPAIAKDVVDHEITAQGLDGLFEKIRGPFVPTTYCPNDSTR